MIVRLNRRHREQQAMPLLFWREIFPIRECETGYLPSGQDLNGKGFSSELKV